jgi:hypothetical protein
MAFDPTSSFQQLGAALKAPQYGQVNPDLSMSLGQSMRGMALQNAMNKLKSGDISLQGQEQQLSNQERMDQLQNQQAGPLDWLGAGVGAGGLLNSALNRKNKTTSSIFDKLGF